MKKILSRQELYDLVWSKPMVQLAQDFELSDVGLKKICKAAYIPTPTLGYWAKKQNGKNFWPMLQIRDVVPGSSDPDFFPPRISDT